MPRRRVPSEPCPCRVRETVPRSYADCCGRWHAGYARGEHAPEPELLMRSRYSAYALAQGGAYALAQGSASARLQGRVTGHPSLLDYLLATWHPSTSPGSLQLGPLPWIGLDVIAASTTDDAGVVEFVAHHKAGGRAGRLHETSRFVREGGRWLYLNGVVGGVVDAAPAG